MLRKAFTMIELIFLITIVGIISALIIPRMQDTNLQEATDQVIKHIRLTQSLALSQDFYLAEASQSNEYSDPVKQTKSSVQWFKRWWQIQIHSEGTANSAYSVYSDYPTGGANNQFDSNPDYSATFSNGDIIAVDPYTGLLIANVNTTNIPQNQRLTDVDIGNKYNVQIVMSNCVSVTNSRNSNHIHFDHLGRPHCAKSPDDASLNPFDQLMRTQARITLTHLGTSESSVVCVEPESGFTHICG